MTVDPEAETAAEPGREAGALVAGATLGKYRLDRVLGSGGMGIVWAAFDPDLERAVAIKLLRSPDNEATQRARLLREARAMARLKHPNVLTVYEVGTVQNRDYIAMELVEGDNLDSWLASRPPREQIIDALLAAGRGLAAAHAAGLVHRDFKPHNVLRSRDGHVYVTDFGLARGQIEEGPELAQVAATVPPHELATGSQRPRRAVDSVLASPLTQTGVLIGTPAYMAPEQFAGRAPDARSDQFAFCVAAWEALAGKRPFHGSSLVELEAAAAAGLPSIGTDLPAHLRAMLVRGLDPSPERRWPDMDALLRAFGEVLAPPPPRKRRWPFAAGLGATALAIAGALAVAVRGGGGASAILGGTSPECGPAEQAFERAWSPARRAAVIDAHPQVGRIGMIGGLAILDEVRQEWMRAYRTTCAEPRTERNRARLACLHETRDAVARTTTALADPAVSFDMNRIIPLATSLAMCSVDLGFGDDDKDEDKNQDEDKDHAFPWMQPPGPPIPPVPPPPEPPRH